MLTFSREFPIFAHILDPFNVLICARIRVQPNKNHAGELMVKFGSKYLTTSVYYEWAMRVLVRRYAQQFGIRKANEIHHYPYLTLISDEFRLTALYSCRHYSYYYSMDPIYTFF